MASPSASMMQKELLAKLRDIVPPLTAESHKGEHGKVGILGGCREYTGAPYFSAISAVKVGADLSHVFCTPSASQAIKAYSPELIVLPFLPDSEEIGKHEGLYGESEERIDKWLSRMGCLVAGPGLGDDPHVIEVSKRVIRAARQQGLPMIIDGSALNFLAKEPGLVQGYDRCILTPNMAEFGRLAQGVGVQLEGAIGTHWQKHTQELAVAFDGPVVVSKGPADMISDCRHNVACDQQATLKRAGGQGDVMTGAIAAFVCWAKLHARKHPDVDWGMNPMMLAAYGGSLVMRTASLMAFKQHGRAMLAGDIIPYLQPALQQWVPDA